MTTTHIIEPETNDHCRYAGRCSCGVRFSTNSKAGYTNSTRAHLRQAAKARRETAEGKERLAALTAELTPAHKCNLDHLSHLGKWRVVCNQCGHVGVTQDVMADAVAIAERHEQVGGFER